MARRHESMTFHSAAVASLSSPPAGRRVIEDAHMPGDDTGAAGSTRRGRRWENTTNAGRREARQRECCSRRGCGSPPRPRRQCRDGRAPAASCSAQDCCIPGRLQKSAGARTATPSRRATAAGAPSESKSERCATSSLLNLTSRRSASGHRRPTRRPVSMERRSRSLRGSASLCARCRRCTGHFVPGVHRRRHICP
jgi:hypothetical protein